MIAGEYTVKSKLGFGSFGEIFSGTTKAGDAVAIKFEHASCRHKQLHHESKIYSQLAKTGLFLFDHRV